MIVPTSDCLTLVLTPDNPCNTTITDSDTGKIFYRVATEVGKCTTTRIKNASGETLASWEWREVLPDIITLGQARPISVGAWLKKSLVPFKNTVTFQDFSGGNLKWKGNGPFLSFELYREGDKVNPIARFRKSQHTKNRNVDPPIDEYEPACLLLDEQAEEIQDLVVISFLVLEKSRRALETTTMNRADVLGTPMVVVGTYALTNGGI